MYRARIMLIGQYRAGKTSLKKSLLGLPFDPNEQSTDGIEIDPWKFETDVDQVKNWQRTDEDLGMNLPRSVGLCRTAPLLRILPSFLIVSSSLCAGLQSEQTIK